MREGRESAPEGNKQQDFDTTSPHESVAFASASPNSEISPALRATLPEDTVATWLRVAPLLPESAYLVGGTALAAHLAHRVSRDLDFFLERSEDLHALASSLEAAGHVVFDLRDDTTINCQFNATKVQILDASSQTLVAPTSMVSGVRVAGLDDLLATKLSVITRRGELRDYFDIMAIETQGQLSVEEGLSLALDRYAPASPNSFVVSVLRALGYLGDVADDPSLPVARAEIESYWRARLRVINLRLGESGAG